jgi:hypothetical protein
MKKHLCPVIFSFSSKGCKERILMDKGWESNWFLYTRVELIIVLVWYMSRKVQAESLREDKKVFIEELRVFLWPRMVGWVMVFCEYIKLEIKRIM